MKRLLTAIIIVFLISGSFVFSSEQETAEVLIGWANNVIEKMKTEKGVELQPVDPENIGQIFYLKNEHYIQLEGTFSSGNVFFFLCGDGRQAKQVGVQVLDENGTVLQQDIQGNPYAVGVLQPQVTGTYIIRIILIETTGVPAAHVGYILLYSPTG
jgi:hypothetical protein